jgi:tetratricopeptide (TPR) repeat protein
MKTRTVAAVAFFALAALSCKPGGTLAKMLTIEGRMESKGIAPQTIEELKKGIAEYEKEADRTVAATDKIGTYYKLLAVKYLDKSMYSLAYDSVRKALQYFPTNPNLFYIAAVCSAYMAKAEVGLAGEKSLLSKAEYYKASEAAYLRSLELDPRNTNTMYGLAVLYAFELDRPEDAEGYLQKVLAIEKDNVEAMFVLARVFYVEGRFEDAANEYDKIISVTKVESRKAEAERNKSQVLDHLYGGGTKK